MSGQTVCDTFIMDRIRLVTLDMVGTVIKFQHPPVAQYQRVAAKYVLELNESNNVIVCFLGMDMTLRSTLWQTVLSISG